MQYSMLSIKAHNCREKIKLIKWTALKTYCWAALTYNSVSYVRKVAATGQSILHAR